MIDTVEIHQDRLYRFIGERLKRVRIEAGLTQAQLADRAGVLRSSIANAETARQKTPLHVLYRLCIGLEIETRSILPSNEHVTEPQPIEMDVEGVITEVPPKAAKVLEQLLRE